MEFVAVQNPKDLPTIRRVLSEMPDGKTHQAAIRDGYLPVADATKAIAAVVDVSDTSIALIASTDDSNEDIAHLLHVLRERLGSKSLTCYLVPDGYIRAIYEHRVDQYAMDTSAAAIWDEINDLLRSALQRRASDIYIMTSGAVAQIRFMIDHSLLAFKTLPFEVGLEVARALYRKAPVDAQQRNFVGNEPQETSLECVVENTKIRLRYQHQPIDGGGLDVCLRVLRVSENVSVDLDGLGYTPEQIEVLNPIIGHPKSMIIMNGTTGSGKSRSLATMVQIYDAHHFHRKHIRECSNPVEYDIPNVRQTNIVTQSGANSAEHKEQFVKQLRALMRMNPHAILLGEIRDEQSALFAIDMGLTGHKLFTSIHADTPFDVFDRLRRWTDNEPAFYRDGFIGAVIGQMLLPTVCPGCAVPMASATDLAHKALFDLFLRLHPNDASKVRISGSGCPQCRNAVAGSAGKTVVAQILVPTPDINDALEARQMRKAQIIWATADDVPLGGRTYMHHALYHILRGRMDPFVVSRELDSVESFLRTQLPNVRSVC